MKILHIINVRWWNACAYYAAILAKIQQDKQENVYIIVNKNSKAIPEIKKLNVPFYDNINLDTDNPFLLFIESLKLAKLIKKHKIDIVNAHRGEGFLFIRLAIWLSGNKCYLIRTRGDQRFPSKNIFSKIQNKYLTDGHIVTTKKLENYYLKTNLCKSDKIITIYGGTEDIKPYKKKPASLHNSNKVIIGILGRLYKVKGHQYLIESAKYLKDKGIDNFQILIAGTGEERKNLENLVQRYNLSDKIKFLGFVEDRNAFLHSLDIAVISSIGSEMICRVGFEYMCAGLPIVATKVNSIAEIMQDNYNAILVKPNDSEQLTKALSKLISSKELRNRMGKHSRKIFLTYYQVMNFYQSTKNFYEAIRQKF
ncbi:MAG: hypothetical protein DRH57_02785 [Candidatus Cloacimonadota bacterium]|nr:MAG: hypothetical protein DRH57_02785 [Candidatus Cloacimonadota bacterium]